MNQTSGAAVDHTDFGSVVSDKALAAGLDSVGTGG